MASVKHSSLDLVIGAQMIQAGRTCYSDPGDSGGELLMQRANTLSQWSADPLKRTLSGVVTHYVRLDTAREM